MGDARASKNASYLPLPDAADTIGRETEVQLHAVFDVESTAAPSEGAAGALFPPLPPPPPPKKDNNRAAGCAIVAAAEAAVNELEDSEAAEVFERRVYRQLFESHDGIVQ